MPTTTAYHNTTNTNYSFTKKMPPQQTPVSPLTLTPVGLSPPPLSVYSADHTLKKPRNLSAPVRANNSLATDSFTSQASHHYYYQPTDHTFKQPRHLAAPARANNSLATDSFTTHHPSISPPLLLAYRPYPYTKIRFNLHHLSSSEKQIIM